MVYLLTIHLNKLVTTNVLTREGETSTNLAIQLYIDLLPMKNVWALPKPYF